MRIGILLLLAFPTLALSEDLPVGIFFDFEQNPAPGLLELMQRQADQLLQPAGVSLAWRKVSASKGDEAFSKVFIVKLKGSCNAASLRAMPVSEMEPFVTSVKLAATRVADGEVKPFAEVECDTLRKGIGRVPWRQRAAAFAQAVGRVIAHELYHFLLNTTTHASEGLAQSVIRFEDLSHSAFTAADIGKLKQAH